MVTIVRSNDTDFGLWSEGGHGGLVAVHHILKKIPLSATDFTFELEY